MTFSILGRGSLGTFGDNVLSLEGFLKSDIAFTEKQVGLTNSGIVPKADNVDISQIMGNVKYNRISQVAKYGIKTSDEALTEAGLKNINDYSKIGIFMGTEDGPDVVTQKFYRFLRESGYKKGNPLQFPETTMNVPANYIGIAHKVTGPIINNASDFTSGYETMEIAMNYLSYGAIDYALVVCAEEYSDYSFWRAQKQEPEGTLFEPGASCLVLKKGACSDSEGIIKSVSIIQDDNFENAVALTVGEALEKAELEPAKIDLVINQHNGISEINFSKGNYLHTLFSENTPNILLKPVARQQFGITTLLNIICATLIKQDTDIWNRYMQKKSRQQKRLYHNMGVRTVLLTSLIPEGKCGALILEI
jgi:hypothetical protein